MCNVYCNPNTVFYIKILKITIRTIELYISCRSSAVMQHSFLLKIDVAIVDSTTCFKLAESSVVPGMTRKLLLSTNTLLIDTKILRFQISIFYANITISLPLEK